MKNKSDKKIQNTDPAKIDDLAEGKYMDAMEQRTKDLPQKSDTDNNDFKTEFNNANDSPSSADEEGQGQVGPNNVTAEEIEDLDKSANYMPEEQLEMEQMEGLDDVDLDGTPLNEGEDILGDDLDVDEQDEDANVYDDNE